MRFEDTLFKRLFLLMCVAVFVSHVAAFGVVMRLLPTTSGLATLADAPGAPDDWPQGAAAPSLPPVPGLPPTPGLDLGAHATAATTLGNAPSHAPPALPTGLLLLDYAIRLAVIGAFAWWGARWVARPVRRLVDAADALAPSLGNAALPARLDEAQGTREVRDAARVFNAMATKLDQLFRGRTLLVAAISHDLRTPLTRLRMRLESMTETAARRCIEDVREIDELIDQSLEVFRGAQHQEPPQPTDLFALAEALVEDLCEQGHAATVSGQRGAQAAVPPRALRRALGNLLGNAVRYGGRADVSVQRRPHGDIDIVVEDRGPGIPAAQLEAVFAPFFRLDASRNRRTGGSGLGLFIARDLVERAGGRLSLANRDGGGLRATIVLPPAARSAPRPSASA